MLNIDNWPYSPVSWIAVTSFELVNSRSCRERQVNPDDKAYSLVKRVVASWVYRGKSVGSADVAEEGGQHRGEG